MIGIDPGPILIAAGAALAVMFFILGSAALVRAPRSHVMSRVAALERRNALVRQDVTLLRDRSTSEIRALDLLLRGRQWAQDAELLLDRARLPLRVGEYLAIRGLAIVLGALVAGTFARPLEIAPVVGVLVGAVAGFFVPRVYIGLRVSKRKRLMEGQLIELCDLMASMLRSGFGAFQAIQSTADQIGEPLALELRRVLDAVRLGVDVDEAFEAMNQRIAAPDFTVLATAITIQRRTGGNLAEILEGVADTIRDRQALRQEISALTAMEQATAGFAALFPLALITVLFFLAPTPFRMLLTETTGRMILLAAITMDAVGFFVMRRATRIEA